MSARAAGVAGATRSQIAARHSSDDDDTDSYQSSPFFSPPEEERGCPICRKVPTDFLRLFPEIFSCTVCLSDDVTNVFALISCGHCLCGNCKDIWVPNPGSPRLPDISYLNISNNQRASGGRRGRPLTSPYQRNADATRRRKAIIMAAIESGEINNGIITDAIFTVTYMGLFSLPTKNHVKYSGYDWWMQ